MTKRVCYILPTFAIAGGVMVVLEHANRLINRGFEISLLNIGKGDSLDWYPGNRASLYSVDAGYPKTFDIVVATGWTTAYKARLLGLNASRWMYLVQSDESLFAPDDSLEAVLARMTYFAPYEYLVVARWLKEWLHRDFGQEALYVPNALNGDLMFQTEPIVQRTRQLRVLIEGPMHTEYKGIDDAFAAVRELEVEIWFVTNGKPKPNYRYDRLFKSVPYDQMREIYSSCDVLLKMSKVESFGYPPLEMMACGGTAVITRFTGHEEYARDGENCLVVDIGDVSAAIDRIRRLSNDRSLLDRLKQNGLKTAAQKTNWEGSIDLLEELFKSEQPKIISSTPCEKNALQALALLTDKLVIDYHNNRIGTSMECLQRLNHLETKLQVLKNWGIYSLVKMMLGRKS